MKTLFYISIIILVLTSCNSGKTKKTEIKTQTTVKTEVKKILPPLENSELKLNEDAFGKIIELKGESHPVENFFKVKEFQMIVKDSLLITKSFANNDIFMVYSLPEFKLLKTFGKHGNGPKEFFFPQLVKTNDDKYLCYINNREKLYALDRNLNIIKANPSNNKAGKQYSQKKFHSFSPQEFYYCDNIKRGKAIFKYEVHKDSVKKDLITNLNFSPKHKNWAAYIGDFGGSAKNQRLVYAYKYFKRLLFHDLKNNTTRTVSFESEDAKKGTAVDMLKPTNVTHYWGMSAETDYLYVLYSGRTPIQVGKENKNTSGYIYVEKYDWNGNPISKYKLDHWGYFCVDEKNSTIYVASNLEEHPFYSYKI